MLRPPDYVSFRWLAETMDEVPYRVPGAVKTKILRQGNGPFVPQNAIVKIHFASYYEYASEPFSSTVQQGKKSKYLQVSLGTGTTLTGLELAFRHVRGPKAYFLALLQPDVTSAAEDPRISFEPVLFVVAMFGVKELQPYNMFYYMKKEQQGKYALIASTVQYLKEKAKGFFQKQSYERAVEVYKQTADVISHGKPENEQERQGIKDMRVQVLLNMAVCYNKLDKPKGVLKLCGLIEKEIDLDTHCKALFYKGRAYENLHKDEKALELYKKALNLEPNNKDINAAITDLNGRLSKSKVKECNMWQSVFNKLGKEVEEEKEAKEEREREEEENPEIKETAAEGPKNLNLVVVTGARLNPSTLRVTSDRGLETEGKILIFY